MTHLSYIISFSVSCLWSEWQIGTCNKTCGGGWRTDTRYKVRDEKYGGLCRGDHNKTVVCNNPCPSKLNLTGRELYCL